MPDRVISVPQATQIAQRIKNKFDNVNGRLTLQEGIISDNLTAEYSGEFTTGNGTQMLLIFPVNIRSGDSVAVRASYTGQGANKIDIRFLDADNVQHVIKTSQPLDTDYVFVADADYVKCSLFKGLSQSEPGCVLTGVVVIEGKIPGEIKELREDIDWNTDKIAQVETEVDGFKPKVSVVRDRPHSQTISPLEWLEGVYTNTGAISTSLPNYNRSEHIEVIPGTDIVYTNLRGYTGWPIISAFDKDSVFLASDALISTGTEFVSGTWTVPEGVKYVSLTAYKPVTTTVNRWSVVIPERVYVADFIDSVTGPWNGKTAVIIGDSITEGLYTPVGGSSPDVRANPTFWETAGSYLGADFIGYGISGTSISRTSETLPSYAMSIRYADMVNGADLVIVAGGTNDYGTNVVLGTIEDTTDISFYGALHVLCDGLQSKYPGRRIVFISPIHRVNEGANTAGYTLSQYRKAIVDVARDAYGFAVIDGYQMGISCSNASFKNDYIYDGLHPTQLGHNLYGQCLGHALSCI